MKTYLIVSGTIFGLLAVGHVYELISRWQASSPADGFAWIMAAIIVLCGGLSLWAFRLLKSVAATAA